MTEEDKEFFDLVRKNIEVATGECIAHVRRQIHRQLDEAIDEILSKHNIVDCIDKFLELRWYQWVEGDE